MYTQFYNFSEKPFNLTPDPKFLFYTPSHREALASMIYGINERRGFVCITGEVGTGKTTLIYTLLSNLNEKVKTAFVYHTTATFEELLGHILLDLNVPIGVEDKASLVRKLNNYLIQHIAQDETLAIIVDEAQNIPAHVMEEFRLLSNLETPKQKLLQIILVGQPELETKLNSPELRQFKQRIGIRRTIKPLTPQESKEYIEHRLGIAGSATDKVFTSDAVSLICRYADGIPRVINILCDNAFLIGYGLSQKKITEKIISEVIRDLDATVEKIPSPPVKETPLYAAENKSAGKNIRFYLASFLVLITLAVISLSIRGFLKEETEHKNAIQPTKIKPETQPAVPVNTPPQPAPAEATPQEAVANGEKTPKTSLLKEGGSLYSLALKNYQRANPTIYDLILKANPGINDIRRIPDYKKITLPIIEQASFIEKSGDNSYLVFVGTFETRKRAGQISVELAGMGKKPAIKAQKFSSKDTWYRLTLGDFKNREEAIEAVDYLIKKSVITIPQHLP